MACKRESLGSLPSRLGSPRPVRPHQLQGLVIGKARGSRSTRLPFVLAYAPGPVCLVGWSFWSVGFFWMNFQSDQPDKRDRPDEPSLVDRAQRRAIWSPCKVIRGRARKGIVFSEDERHNCKTCPECRERDASHQDHRPLKHHPSDLQSLNAARC